jgi:hypothetical protein
VIDCRETTSELDSLASLQTGFATSHCTRWYRFQWFAVAFLLSVPLQLLLILYGDRLEVVDRLRSCRDTFRDLVFDVAHESPSASVHVREQSPSGSCRSCLRAMREDAVSCDCGKVSLPRLRSLAFVWSLPPPPPSPPQGDDTDDDPFASADTSTSTGESSTLCTVCLESIAVGDTVVALPPCAHLYHVDCIVVWLAERNVCPLCMTKVKIRQA